MSKPVFQDVFRLSGRRNRKSYFLFALSAFTLMAVVALLAVAQMGMLRSGDMSKHMAELGMGGMAIVGVVLLAISVAGWLVAAQRCRDFGWTGWAVLINLIPYVGWLFGVALLFIPGTYGPNRYGPDPVAPSEQGY